MAAPTLRRRIQSVIERLTGIAENLHSEGLEDEAMSLETTIADLHWQCEEMDELETVSAAPGPRRTD